MAEEKELTQLEEARRTVALFQELVQSQAWVELRKVADAQIHNRRSAYLKGPLKADVSIYQQQFELGEAAGIELFFNIPAIALEAAKAIIKEHEDINVQDSEA